MAFTLPWVGFQDSFFNTSLAHRAHLQFTLRLAFFKEFYSKIWELKSMDFFSSGNIGSLILDLKFWSKTNACDFYGIRQQIINSVTLPARLLDIE